MIKGGLLFSNVSPCAIPATGFFTLKNYDETFIIFHTNEGVIEDKTGVQQTVDALCYFHARACLAYWPAIVTFTRNAQTAGVNMIDRFHFHFLCQ